MSPIVANVLEVVDSPLYDTLSIPLGFFTSDAAELFQNPFGSGGYADPLTGEARPKDLTETNMMEPGMLPAPQKFVVHAIRAALFNRRGTLLPVGDRYYRGAFLDFRIADKTYWRGPLWKVADPAAMFVESNPLASFEPGERIDLVRILRAPIDPAPLIEEQQRFSVVMKFDPSFGWTEVHAPGSLVVLLEGILGRPVV